MTETKSKRVRVRMAINAVCLVLAVLAALWIVIGKTGDDEALAAGAAQARGPAPRAEAGAGADAGGALDAAAGAERAETPPPKREEAEGGGPKEPDPIDLAVAPDGGVPFHPGATHFLSPFAKPGREPAVKARVGILLNSIDDYDVKTGTFTADFFLSLTSPAPLPPLKLQFPNGTLEKQEIIADKPTFKLYRLSGAFKSAADLRNYPFDSQQLRIVVEDDSRGIDQLEFVADPAHTKLARGFRAVGWQVGFVEARTFSQTYPNRFDNDDLYYSRYTFSVGVDRYATSAAFKVFVPAFVIVIISLLGMWVPASEMEVRSNSGAPMLAGAVLFHFALMQELPSTMYLTRADKLMLGVYVSLALGMLSTWWMFLVKEENVPVVFRVARVVVPVLSAITMALACLT